MAVTVTADYRTNDVATWSVVATADADTTTGNIAHGMGSPAPEVEIVPILQASAEAGEWAVTTRDGTNIVLTCGTGAGSGNAGAQVRIIARRRR